MCHRAVVTHHCALISLIVSPNVDRPDDLPACNTVTAMCSDVSRERVFSLGPFDESGLWFPVARGWSNPTTNGYTRLKGLRKRIPIVGLPPDCDMAAI